MIVAAFGTPTGRAFRGVYAEVGYGSDDEAPRCVTVIWSDIEDLEPWPYVGEEEEPHGSHWSKVGGPVRMFRAT